MSVLFLSSKVQVGNFRHIIAKVQLRGSEMAIVVSIVVCCVLLLLCTVGKLCCGWWMCIWSNGHPRCAGDKRNSGGHSFLHLLQLSWKHKDPTVPLNGNSICMPSLMHTWCNCVCRARVRRVGRGVEFVRACVFACLPLSNLLSDHYRNPFVFARELLAHAKILNRNNLFMCCHRQTRSFNPLSLSHILNFIIAWRAVIGWLHVVFHSSCCVLHKEPKGGTLLAENAASDGGDGVPDQRGDP